jgi:hypothetical protein
MKCVSEGPARSGPRFHGRVERPAPERCAAPGCDALGEFRAPRSNRAPGEVSGWQFLCLDHVRDFNATYNFFDGLSPDEIAAAQSPLAGWERAAHDPTVRFNDPLGTLDGRFATTAPARRSATGEILSDADLAALKTLELTATASRADLARAYKALVRRYHPDANAGDRSTERQLQDVVQAYTHLKASRAFARPLKEP